MGIKIAIYPSLDGKPIVQVEGEGESPLNVAEAYLNTVKELEGGNSNADS